MTTERSITNLEELLDYVRTTQGVDMTSLPTFGGPEPEDTVGIWSWDATRLLVGEGMADLRIVARED